MDPFSGDSGDFEDPVDPTDPTAAFGFDDDPDGVDEPLTPAEREDVVADLADLDVFEALLAPRGVRGLVVDCADCQVPHYFGWALLRSNLRQLLDVGTTTVHEPAYDPDPSHYVSWDYARGYVDGVADTAEDGPQD
jgi:hypothetical protein